MLVFVVGGPRGPILGEGVGGLGEAEAPHLEVGGEVALDGATPGAAEAVAGGFGGEFVVLAVDGVVDALDAEDMGEGHVEDEALGDGGLLPEVGGALLELLEGGGPGPGADGGEGRAVEHIEGAGGIEVVDHFGVAGEGEDGGAAAVVHVVADLVEGAPGTVLLQALEVHHAAAPVQAHNGVAGVAGAKVDLGVVDDADGGELGLVLAGGLLEGAGGARVLRHGLLRDGLGLDAVVVGGGAVGRRGGLGLGGLGDGGGADELLGVRRRIGRHLDELFVEDAPLAAGAAVVGGLGVGGQAVAGEAEHEGGGLAPPLGEGLHARDVADVLGGDGEDDGLGLDLGPGRGILGDGLHPVLVGVDAKAEPRHLHAAGDLDVHGALAAAPLEPEHATEHVADFLALLLNAEGAGHEGPAPEGTVVGDLLPAHLHLHQVDGLRVVGVVHGVAVLVEGDDFGREVVGVATDLGGEIAGEAAAVDGDDLARGDIEARADPAALAGIEAHLFADALGVLGHLAGPQVGGLRGVEFIDGQRLRLPALVAHQKQLQRPLEAHAVAGAAEHLATAAVEQFLEGGLELLGLFGGLAALGGVGVEEADGLDVGQHPGAGLPGGRLRAVAGHTAAVIGVLFLRLLLVDLQALNGVEPGADLLCHLLHALALFQFGAIFRGGGHAVALLHGDLAVVIQLLDDVPLGVGLHRLRVSEGQLRAGHAGQRHRRQSQGQSRHGVASLSVSHRTRTMPCAGPSPRPASSARRKPRNAAVSGPLGASRATVSGRPSGPRVTKKSA